MSATAPLEGSTRVTKSIRHHIYLHRALVARRVAVLLLLLYFAVIVNAGSDVFLNTHNGVYSASLNTRLFPIPSIDFGFLPAYRALPQIDVFIYIVFINQGIWIVWMLLGIIYIIMPLMVWAYRTLKRPISKSPQTLNKNEEKVGVLTGSIAVFSIALSVVTFGDNLMYYGPVPLVVVLGLSVALLGFILYEVLKRL